MGNLLMLGDALGDLGTHWKIAGLNSQGENEINCIFSMRYAHLVEFQRPFEIPSCILKQTLASKPVVPDRKNITFLTFYG